LSVVVSLYDSIANIGKLLLDGTINASSTSVSVPGLQNYKFFAAQMASSWKSGVAIGIRASTTLIRFVGISGTQNAGNVTSLMELTVSGNTVSSVTAVLGSSATGITRIYGIF